MGGIFKSVGKAFGSILGIGGKPSAAAPTQQKLEVYDPTKNPDATPLKRNPNIVGAAGVEDKLAQWDALLKQYNSVTHASVVRSGYNADKGTQSVQSEVGRRKNVLAKQIISLEQDILGNIWQAPPQSVTAPTQTPTQVPGSNPAQAQTSNPAPNEAPVSALLENIIGTQLTGTLGTNTSAKTAGGGGPRGRRGRATTILGSGDGSETFGA